VTAKSITRKEKSLANLTLPSAKKAEEAVLGAILNYPEELANCRLEAKHFEDYKHRDIFEMMQRLVDAGKPMNYYSVGEALQNKMAFEGITEKLNYLRESFYFHTTFERLEFEVLEAWRKREAVTQIQEQVARLYKPDTRTEGVFSDMIAEITKISDPLLSEDNSLERLLEHIVNRALSPKKIYGLETGLRDFDLQTHGLQKQEVFILAGEPGAGKSILSGQLAFGMAENGHAGVFYSLEMSPEALYMRWLSAKSGISTDRLKEGWDMLDELDNIRDMLDGFKKLPITIRGQIGWTPVKLRSDIARLKHQKNIEFVILDYMDLVADPSADGSTERSENVSRALHNISLEFDVAILAIRSLVKAGYRSDAAMEHISGGHGLTYDMDQGAVLIGNREQKVKELKWVKIRHADDARGLKLMLKKGLPEFVSVVNDETYNDHTV
jgi:replicative DNA helicase